MTITDATPATGLEAARRAAYTAGLRALADVLDKHPEVPLPYAGDLGAIDFYFTSCDDPRAAMAAAARAIPCKWDKRTTANGSFFYLSGHLAGLRIDLTANRDDVCERVVVGVEDKEVEEEVTPAVVRKVTKPVEVVEWRCGSVLAPRPATQAGGTEAA